MEASARSNTGLKPTMLTDGLSIAIFHDNFAQMGGAERVAAALKSTFPEADLRSTLAVFDRLTPKLAASNIATTWMQKLPRIDKFYRHYFLIYPLAIETANLSKYDLIISSCFGYAKGVRKKKGAIHVCYCHTPPRWIWRYNDYSLRERFSLVRRLALPILLKLLSWWDRRAANRPDFFIANSTVVAERIWSSYQKPSVVVPPPIDVDLFQPSLERGDYYLILSRLTAYKRIDIAIEACNRLKVSLVVIGDGPDRGRLQEMAGPTITFLGRQPDNIVAERAAACRALIFPGEEDFGMAPLEVNAAGRPAICFKAGGAIETVIPRVTGLLFEEATAESLMSAILTSDTIDWSTQKIRKHAEQYSFDSFAAKIGSALANFMASCNFPQNTHSRKAYYAWAERPMSKNLHKTSTGK